MVDFTSIDYVREVLNDFDNRDYTAEHMDEAQRAMDSVPAALFRTANDTVERLVIEEMRPSSTMAEEYYHGCITCKNFSISFVGNYYSVTEEDAKTSDYYKGYVLNINTEEDYENLKSLFVTHFNKHHTKITRNRSKDSRIYKIVPKPIPVPVLHVVPRSRLVRHQTEIRDVIGDVIGAVIPEFEIERDPVTGRDTIVRGRRRD